MSPRFVIHLGPHKTGSTYLQLCFRNNRAALLERGILFPALWEHSRASPSQTGFAQRLERGQFGELAAELGSAVAPGIYATGIHTVLISSENLSILERPAVQGLREITGGAAVEFVFYLRRWSDLLPSSFQERVKQGAARPLPDYALAHLKNPFASRLLNWELKTAPFRQVFGEESVRFVCYSVLRERDQDIFRHFARTFLGWDEAPPGASKPVNESRSAVEIELLRALNVMRARKGMPENSALRDRFDVVRQSFDLEALFAAMEDFRETLVFRDDWEPLTILHDRLLDRFRPSLVAPHPPAKLFRPKRADLPFFAADYLAEPGIADAVRDIFKALADTGPPTGKFATGGQTGL